MDREPPRTAILVRCHNPSRAMLHRMATWAKEATLAGCSFLVSVDTTHPPGKFSASVLQRFLPDSACVHSYDEASLREAWPTLERDCGPRLDRVTFGGKWREWGGRPCCEEDKRIDKSVEPNTFAWCFHAEAINLCLQQTRTTESFDYLWVLEDDVGVTGNLVEDIFAAYTDEPADLISSRYEPAVCAHNPWMYTDCGSSEFLRCIPRDKRIKSAEHVQRFSRRLLDALRHLSSGRSLQTIRHRLVSNHLPSGSPPPPLPPPPHPCGPVTAWSEMGVPSLCAYLGWAATTFKREHIGRIFRFDGRISYLEWQRLLRDKTLRGKLFHALKF
jgi:hypothetical protein